MTVNLGGEPVNRNGSGADSLFYRKAVYPLAINVSKESRMSQIEPLSRRVVTAAEDAQSVFNLAIIDGCVSQEEIMELQYALDRALFEAHQADLAQSYGVYVMRGGPDGNRADRLQKQWEELQDLKPCRPTLVLVARNDFPRDAA